MKLALPSRELAQRRALTAAQADRSSRASADSRIDAHDDERAERLDGAELGRRRAGKAQAAADIGLDLALAQRLGGALGSERPDLDLVRIVGRIDRQLVAAPCDGRGRRREQNECTNPFHAAVKPASR